MKRIKIFIFIILFILSLGFFESGVWADTGTGSVTVGVAPSVTLTASPTSGSSTTLSWTVSGTATFCTGSGDAAWDGIKSGMSGSQALSGIGATTTYYIVCSNAYGDSPTASATVTVSVVGVVPTIVLSASASSIGDTYAIVYTGITSLGTPALVDDFGIKYGTVSGSLTPSLSYGGSGFVYDPFSNYISSGLSVCTKYYYRGYAINATGTGYSRKKYTEA